MYGLIQQVAETTGKTYPAIIYASPIIYIAAGILCWFVSMRPIIENADIKTLGSIESTILGVGMFLLSLFFLGENLPQLIERYAFYRSLEGAGSIDAAFNASSDTIRHMLLLGSKSLFGLILALFSVRSKRIVFLYGGWGHNAI